MNLPSTELQARKLARECLEVIDGLLYGWERKDCYHEFKRIIRKGLEAHEKADR